MIHHVIWDFDGTLFDSYPVMSRAFREALAELKCPNLPTQAEITDRMKETMDEAYRVFVRERGLDESAFNQLYTPLRKRLEASDCAPFAPAQRLCRQIRAAGGQNYIFTHRSRSALPMLEAYGMHAEFAEIITSEDGFDRKPSPAAIVHLMKKYDMRPDDAIIIGDREIDILSGVNARIHSCLIEDKPRAQSAAEFRVRGFSELYDVLGLPRK